SVVDNAVDGIVVTGSDGRVVYANAAYLDLTDAADANDLRPVERAFIGDADASEAIYRLLKAARDGKRLQEEVRIAGMKGRPARWLRFKIRPLGNSRRDKRLTVWSLADVTREREGQENVFQELRHAIDYLDHAPAGFFSVDDKGEIVYLNATLANWLDPDLAQGGSAGLKLADLVSGDGAALLTMLRAAPGEVKTEVLDLDLRTRSGRRLPVRVFHKLAYGADGTPGASRTLEALQAAIQQAAHGKSDIAPVDATLAGGGERFGRFYVTAVEEEERDQEIAIVYALETTAQRELENK